MDVETEPQAPALRAALVDSLRANGTIRTPAVADAMLATPRHEFVPEVDIKAAYTDQLIDTKLDHNGVSLSPASQPTIVAMMLEQLDVRPGDNVLEIGAGTGYNAAVLARLAGPNGRVTTIDIDEDITDRAARSLAATGHDRVNVVTVDGVHGDPTHAPYDRIVATVGVPEVSLAWIDQLAPNGRLVAPIVIRGLMRVVGFDKVGDHRLESRSVELAAFVPLRGEGSAPRPVVELAPTGAVVLTVAPEEPVGTESLRQALTIGARADVWTGVTIGNGEPFAPLDLWLASTRDGFGVITATEEAVDAGLVKPALGWGGSAVVDKDSVAYLSLRRATAPTAEAASPGWELGVYAHGPSADVLAHRTADHVRAWDRDHRKADPVITIEPLGTANNTDGQLVLTGRNTRVTLNW